MIPRPSGKYVGFGPLSLAKLTHQFEGENDVEFLAIQDAVGTLTDVEQRIYRDHYLRLIGLGRVAANAEKTGD
jgi:hypothetical protein